MIKRYSDTLEHRAEHGDLEAKLALALATASDGETKSLLEAATTLEAMCESRNDPNAMYYYALYLAHGGFQEVALAPGGAPQDEVYFIDVDNLDEFLGLDHGVSPEGGSPESFFDFKKWLRTERRKRMAEQRQYASPGSDTTSSGSGANASGSNTGSCADQQTTNYERAASLLEQAASLGHEKALITLMLLRLDPSTPLASESKAKEIIETLKEKKSGLGLLRAAERLEDASLYQLASQTGYPEAIYQEALLFHQDESHQESFLQLLQAAALAGHKPALYHAAQVETQKGSHANPTAILKLYQHAADPPNPDKYACFELGNIYYQGLYGVPVNYPLAFKYWKLGARRGHSTCMLNVASMYFNGIGTPQDFEKAFYSNQNAAVLGETAAMINLADMYERGIGVPKSLEQAEYYRKLASGEADDGSIVLDQILQSMEQKDAKQL